MYKLSLTILGKEYKSTGKTVEEALDKIPLKWSQVKAVAKNVVLKEVKKKDDKMVTVRESKEITIAMPVMRRIKSLPVARNLWARRLESYLK